MLALNEDGTEMPLASVSPQAEKPAEESSMLSVTDKLDANSSTIIGSPLQASSPTIVGFRAEGDGDGHSVRSVHSLLSPIHCGRTSHQINFPTIETPPHSSHNTSPARVTVDSFLTNFEQSSSVNKSSRPYSLEQELILSEKITGMEEGEARKLLAKVLIDNMGLRQELRTKEKRIIAYKGQMLAILDWKARQDCDGESNDSNTPTKAANQLTPQESAKMNTGTSEPRSGVCASREKGYKESKYEMNMIPQKTIHSSQEITMVEEVHGMRRSLSFIQELASSIDVDDTLKDRLKDGCYLTNQLLLGGITGWMSALFVKKFGKLALSAAGGGLILLVYTARKGFVNVNYESIYQEISRFCDNPEGADVNNHNNESDDDLDLNCTSDVNEASFSKSRESWFGDSMNVTSGFKPPPGADELNQRCTYDKFRHAKNWITSHTYTVGGFVLTFVYNLI